MKRARHNSFEIANEFIRRGIDANDPITPMEVQKLMYFAHGWMLALHERPLHTDAWRAWQYGPVLPRVYRELREYRADPVEELIGDYRADLDDEERYIIDEVYRLYSPFKGIELSELTHLDGSPWDQARKQNPGANPVIYDVSIKDYFNQLKKNQSE